MKELLEFCHEGGNVFKIKVVAKQKTDFDEMLHFLEDKNLLSTGKTLAKARREISSLILREHGSPSRDLANIRIDRM